MEIKFEKSSHRDKFIIRERSNSESQSTAQEKKPIKQILRKFLGRRPSREHLERTGIIKNEPIFGNTLVNLYQKYDSPVPSFIGQIIEIIEKPFNITSLGIYRASGNLATIQKIRFAVDKDNLSILKEYEKDTDVLTGALKMFFRELGKPLISNEVYEKLLDLAGM